MTSLAPLDLSDGRKPRLDAAHGDKTPPADANGLKLAFVDQPVDGGAVDTAHQFASLFDTDSQWFHGL